MATLNSTLRQDHLLSLFHWWGTCPKLHIWHHSQCLKQRPHSSNKSFYSIEIIKKQTTTLFYVLKVPKKKISDNFWTLPALAAFISALIFMTSSAVRSPFFKTTTWGCSSSLSLRSSSSSGSWGWIFYKKSSVMCRLLTFNITTATVTIIIKVKWVSMKWIWSELTPKSLTYHKEHRSTYQSPWHAQWHSLLSSPLKGVPNYSGSLFIINIFHFCLVWIWQKTKLQTNITQPHQLNHQSKENNRQNLLSPTSAHLIS